MRCVAAMNLTHLPLPGGGYRVMVIAAKPLALRLSIMTPGGRVVRRINGPAATRNAVLDWDGTGGLRRKVPAGVYLAVVTGNGRVIGTRKIFAGAGGR